MSKNFEVGLRISLKGNQEVAKGIRGLERQFTGLGDHATRAMGKTAQMMRNLNHELNGFSSISKLAAALGGLSAARNVLSSNLDFERDVLEMKQNAQMTMKQSQELRRLALDSARDSLATPQELMAGMKAFARAGDKFENIKTNALEAARAASVLRASVEEVANMDFDLRDKLGIKNDRMGSVHNMLYYHGNAGRFEGKALAQFAPELFNSVANVGIGGERGLNFTGALTQVLMKSASVNEPGKVKTLMEQGLGHITSKGYVEGLRKVGIDVKRFAPGGKFSGEGGVDGLLALADAMKSKGLMNPFKLSQAGFRDQETIKFFRGLMQYGDKIRSEMGNAEAASKRDQIALDFTEIKEANFGKIKAAEIEVEKLKLSDNATKATGMFADAANWGSQNPWKTGALAGVAVLGGKKLAGKWMGQQLGKIIERSSLPRTIMTRNPFTGVTSAIANPALASGIGGGLARVGKLLKWGGPAALLGLGAYDAYGISQNAQLSDYQRKLNYSRIAGETAGGIGFGWGGAAAGAALGTAIMPGIGTVAGGLIGGFGGAALGSWGTGAAMEVAAKGVMGREGLNSPPVIVNNVNNIILDGELITQSINQVNSRESRRQ